MDKNHYLVYESTHPSIGRDRWEVYDHLSLRSAGEDFKMLAPPVFLRALMELDERKLVRSELSEAGTKYFRVGNWAGGQKEEVNDGISGLVLDSTS
jgi:hypothetical protein